MIGISARASIARLTAFASAAILTAGLAACASQETEPATPAVEVPANDNLNAVLWTQRSVEFKGNAETAFALARIRLDQALRDRGWTAAPAEQTGNYRRLPPAVVLDMEFHHQQVNVYFRLLLEAVHAGVEIDYISFEQSSDDPDENTQRLIAAIGDARLAAYADG